MRREDSLEKTLMLGKSEGKRRRGQQRSRWLDSVTEATNMNLTKLQEAVEDRRAWCTLVHGVTKSRTQLNNNKRLPMKHLICASYIGRVALFYHQVFSGSSGDQHQTFIYLFIYLFIYFTATFTAFQNCYGAAIIVINQSIKVHGV